MPQEIKYKKPWENTPRSNVFMLRMRNTFHSVLSSRPFVHLTYVSFTNLSEKTELGVFILKCTLGEPGHHANWRTLSKVSVDSASVQMLLLKLLATPALHIFFFSLMHHFITNWWANNRNGDRFYFGGAPNHMRWWL